MDKKSFSEGVSSSYPVCISFFVIFSALGILAHIKGFSLFDTVLMTATIFAAPLQALLIENQDLTAISVIINSFIMNFKFLLMSFVLVTIWGFSSVRSIPVLHFICSSTYIVASSNRNIRDPYAYYIGIALPSYFVAVISTMIGYLLLSINQHLHAFLEIIAHIILPIHFTCLTIKRKKEKFVILATLLGFILTPVIKTSIGKQFSIIIWTLLAISILYIERSVCKKQL